MSDKKCPLPVQVAVPWAGKINMACMIHANDLVVLGNVIGSPVQPRLIESEEPCYGKDDHAEREEAAKEAENTE